MESGFAREEVNDRLEMKYVIRVGHDSPVHIHVFWNDQSSSLCNMSLSGYQIALEISHRPKLPIDTSHPKRQNPTYIHEFTAVSKLFDSKCYAP
jgi:hypothetical protein